MSKMEFMMKKILLPICMLSLSIALCSCLDTRVMDIDNITWKEDTFKIEVTSEQLQKQFWDEREIDDNNYYSNILIRGEIYSCTIYMANTDFMIMLYDSSNDSIIYFYGTLVDFISGSYDLYKEKNKEYKYSLNVTLKKSGQYYEYCTDNNIEFPKTITLYGYEN